MLALAGVLLVPVFVSQLLQNLQSLGQMTLQTLFPHTAKEGSLIFAVSLNPGSSITEGHHHHSASVRGKKTSACSGSFVPVGSKWENGTG